MRIPLALSLIFLLGACSEFDLFHGDKPDPTDTGNPPAKDSGNGDSGDTHDTDTPDDTGKPWVETGLPPDAATDPLYAHTSDSLYSVSPKAPYDQTLIGRFKLASGANVTEITDVAIDSGGIMYAVTFTSFYRVDASNAEMTPVSSTGMTDLNALTFLADGTLLAGGGSALYEVDPTSGVFTRLSDIGNWYFAGDMVGLPDGLLYCAMSLDSMGGSTNLVVFDMSTNTIVRTGATGTSSLYGVAYALETLFGFSADGNIYTIESFAGAATRVASSGKIWWGATTNPVVW